MLANLLDGLVGGDEFPLRGHVDSEETGGNDGRSGDPHMHLAGARAPYEADHAGRGGAADDAVVDDDDTLAGEDLVQGIELQADPGLADALVGLDEGAAHIAVLDEALAVGDAAFARIPDGSGNGRIGYADDDVGFHGVLAGELSAHLLADWVEQMAGKVAIGASEVDELEGTESSPRGWGNGEEAPGTGRIDLNDLSRSNLSLHRHTQVLEGA